jgi:two-component system, chemotaxis family, CheB/CheR fusion protein
MERSRSTHSPKPPPTRVLPYRSVDDRIEGVVITFMDIDARKRANDILRISEERLRRMVNVDVVGVLIFDENGTLIDCNDAFLKMTGYSQMEVKAKQLNWRTMTPPEYIPASEEQMRKMAENGRIGPYEKEYFLKGGSRSWMMFGHMPDNMTEIA